MVLADSYECFQTYCYIVLNLAELYYMYSIYIQFKQYLFPNKYLHMATRIDTNQIHGKWIGKPVT